MDVKGVKANAVVIRIQDSRVAHWGTDEGRLYLYFYLGRNICYFNKIFNRVHQLEFSVCFEPFTYAIYVRKTLWIQAWILLHACMVCDISPYITTVAIYIGLPAFLLLFLLCVQSSKSCCEGSILLGVPKYGWEKWPENQLHYQTLCPRPWWTYIVLHITTLQSGQPSPVVI